MPILSSNLKQAYFDIKSSAYEIFFYYAKLKKLKFELENCLNEKINEDLFVSSLKDTGLFIVNDFLSNNLKKILKREYNKIIEIKNNSFDENLTKTIQVRNYDKTFYLQNKLFLNYLIFTNQRLKNLLQKITKKKFNFNSEIFFQKTFETTKLLAVNFHYDKMRSIKIWIYINDCNYDNGPLECITGTHQANKKIRENIKNEILEDNNKNNFLENQENQGLKLTAKAGSLIIFDSDVSHKATPVLQGKTREIVRGATFI